MLNNWLNAQLLSFGFKDSLTDLLTVSTILVFLLLILISATVLVRRILLKFLLSWIKSNDYHWDDPLSHSNFLSRLSWLVPLIIVSLSLDTLLSQESAIYILSKRLTLAGFVIVGVLSLTALLKTANEIYQQIKKSPTSMLQGYIDALAIIIYLWGGMALVSIFTDKTFWGIFSILGGLTAVTMLVFKDTILGFVASIQLTSTDMIRVGDWIEMEQYGADGDVIKMSINTVRVQNWDKTITTIPTYALVSSSFKNWRGMSDSGGRRIKRSLSIDIGSIRFCDQEMLDRFGKMSLLRDYLNQKDKEIREYNKNHNVDSSEVVNGRHQTNIGVFRAYIVNYLKNNPRIHKNMTFLVRHHPPGPNGLPLEIYVFSNDQVWSNYEAIQADIFDHLLAAAPEFGLRIFQNPTGWDMKGIGLKV